MQQMTTQMEQTVSGGSFIFFFGGIAISVALYKVLMTRRGRISIPRLISIEWG